MNIARRRRRDVGRGAGACRGVGVGVDDDCAFEGGDEFFLDGLVDEGEQRVVVAVDVEEAHGLGVDAVTTW